MLEFGSLLAVILKPLFGLPCCRPVLLLLVLGMLEVLVVLVVLVVLKDMVGFVGGTFERG